MLRISCAAVLAFAAVGCSPADTIDQSQAEERKLDEIYNPLPRHFQTKDNFAKAFAHRSGGSNLSYHGGPTLTNAHVVAIFWGPSWSSSDPISSSLTRYIAAYGNTGEYNVITQYSGIQKSSLGGTAWYDSSTPPTDVTDADVQAEVSKYLSSHAFDASAIYEVFLPKSSYSTNGSSGSCGAPNLQYCAYHGNFSASQGNVKYGSMPYPSCSGCSGFGSDTQNFEHFIAHETREAVTDADGNAWYDSRGYEADDKCAWTPAPFEDCSTGSNADGTCFAYQYEWSNAVSGCVQTQ